MRMLGAPQTLTLQDRLAVAAICLILAVFLLLVVAVVTVAEWLMPFWGPLLVTIPIVWWGWR